MLPGKAGTTLSRYVPPQPVRLTGPGFVETGRQAACHPEHSDALPVSNSTAVNM